MKIIKTAIDGVVIIEPRIFKDQRGYFFESFSQKQFSQEVTNIHFVQDNESKSTYGVLRGLHFQKPPFAQAKLIRVIHGHILDVAVDIRKNSPTYGQHVEIELSDKNKQQLFIPHGFAHGFVVLSPEAVVQYKCDNYYNPEHEGSLRWDDPKININWRLDKEDIILSDKDKVSPFLEEVVYE